MQRVDEFLNSLTMYKTVLYGLITLVACTLIVSILGSISFTPFMLLASLGLLVGICGITNFIFAKIFKAQTNTESYIISALILFFIMTPDVSRAEDLISLIAVGFFAMASKYIFAIKKKHLFNPVAISAVLIGLTGLTGASWWIATPVMLPAVTIVGLLIIRKLRKFSMFFAFLGVVAIEMLFFGLVYNTSSVDVITQLILSWPVIFFATIMLTEPLTMPPTRVLQMMYGGLVGFLFAFQLPLGPILMSPELALVIGNIFSYFVSSRQKIILTLKSKEKLSKTIYSYVFTQSERLNFTAGQYIEWTLPHKNPDSRGNRRYFTIASSPTEEDIMLGVRISDDGSSFKKALLELEKNARLSAGSLKGDFTLPDNKNKKLVFLAGGIGITPFRSMIKYLLDKGEKRDIILFHTCSNGSDFVYADLFKEAEQKMNMKINYLLSEKENVPANYEGKFGHLTKEMIKDAALDFNERIFYISGSSVMVDAYKKALKELGVPKTNIVTDYFSGY